MAVEPFTTVAGVKMTVLAHGCDDVQYIHQKVCDERKYLNIEVQRAP